MELALMDYPPRRALSEGYPLGQLGPIPEKWVVTISIHQPFALLTFSVGGLEIAHQQTMDGSRGIRKSFSEKFLVSKCAIRNDRWACYDSNSNNHDIMYTSFIAGVPASRKMVLSASRPVSQSSLAMKLFL